MPEVSAPGTSMPEISFVSTPPLETSFTIEHPLVGVTEVDTHPLAIDPLGGFEPMSLGYSIEFFVGFFSAV